MTALTLSTLGALVNEASEQFGNPLPGALALLSGVIAIGAAYGVGYAGFWVIGKTVDVLAAGVQIGYRAVTQTGVTR